MIVHLADAHALPRWARHGPAGAKRARRRILARTADIDPAARRRRSDAVTGGQASVGLRVPAQPIAHALLAKLAELGCDGVAAPSANRFGRISATTAQHVADEFGDTIALILDGGPSTHGIESTIVDFSSGEAVSAAARVDHQRGDRTRARPW